MTRTSTVTARFFLDPAGGLCAHALISLVPDRAPEIQAPEKKPVPFRSSGLHSLPRRKVSQRPMRLFPYITRAFWRDPDEWAADSCCQFSASCREPWNRTGRGTSFKYVKYWPLRNLLKITRCLLRVNGESSEREVQKAQSFPRRVIPARSLLEHLGGSVYRAGVLASLLHVCAS